MTTPPLRGSCLCGAVRFEVEPPLLRFVHCYCSRCRKASGAGAAANAFVRPEQLRWLSGAERIARWDLPTARSFALAVCGRCGCRVPHATRSGREVLIPAGALDDPPPQPPSERCQWSSRAAWMSLDVRELPCSD